MNCHDVELVMRALVRGQLQDAQIRELSLAHVEQCVSCTERLAAERTLYAGVRAVIAQTSREQAPARVETALLEAFREHARKNAAPTLKVLPVRGRFQSQWGWASAAALILIFVSAFAAWWSQSKAPGETKQAVTPSSIFPDRVARSVKHQDEPASHVTDSSRPSRTRRHLPRRRPREAELVTEFYPLMEGPDLGSYTVVQLVRVELPGSALRAAGLPVGPEMDSEPVKADVMLGYDGLARAIRFVR